MAITSFDRLYQEAKAVVAEIKSMDAPEAELAVVKALMRIDHRARTEMIDAVEIRLLHANHH